METITMENINTAILALLDQAMQLYPDFGDEFSSYFNIVEAKMGVFDEEARDILRYVSRFVG